MLDDIRRVHLDRQGECLHEQATREITRRQHASGGPYKGRPLTLKKPVLSRSDLGGRAR